MGESDDASTTRKRKRSQLVWIGIAGATVGTIALGKLANTGSDDVVAADLFQSREQCVASDRHTAAECATAFDAASRIQQQSAPRYASRDDCEAEFPGTCANIPATSSDGTLTPLFAPEMAGVLIGSALIGFGPAALPVYRGCSSDGNQGTNQADCRSAVGSGGGGAGGFHGGSGGYYTSSGYRIDSNGTRASISNAAFHATPATTTLSRGGFGARAMTIHVAS
jgi:uncharacterized protein YgiB involved in biofilm formation